jgi:hypothetical protein
MTQSMRDRLVNAAAAIDATALVSGMDLTTHVTNYRAAILEGKKVVLVSHSQGNLFANQAYSSRSANERQSFGIASVANPDSFVAGNGPYTMLLEDLVVAAVRAVKLAVGGALPLPPNTTNGLTISDLTGHGFSASYLAGANSSTRITDDVAFLRATLTQPSATGSSGIITVTLTWGSQPDVDLHVFEPNGTHVYYANRFGPSGFLDVDDVSGFGPEHYTVRCTDTLETGTYRIGVNYYFGTAPEVANVVIAAGLNVKSYSIFLSNSLGSSGDVNPVPVGNIVVTVNNLGDFDFSIQ